MFLTYWVKLPLLIFNLSLPGDPSCAFKSLVLPEVAPKLEVCTQSSSLHISK